MDTFLTVFGVAYIAVLLTEMVGDRSLYTIGSLATRFGASKVMCGIGCAFGLKMLVAVAVGEALGLLPAGVVRVLAVASLLGAAAAIWRETHEKEGEHPAASRRGSAHPVLISFTAVFFIEWADPGQLAAAMLSVRYHAPGEVWIAATAALLTKGALAITVGLTLRRWVPKTVLRNATLVTLLCLAMLVAAGVAG
jgi:putative Ca2+/H+ antiporter (TMEM165/GDT1 family)